MAIVALCNCYTQKIALLASKKTKQKNPQQKYSTVLMLISSSHPTSQLLRPALYGHLDTLRISSCLKWSHNANLQQDNPNFLTEAPVVLHERVVNMDMAASKSDLFYIMSVQRASKTWSQTRTALEWARCQHCSLCSLPHEVTVPRCNPEIPGIILKLPCWHQILP